VESFADRSKNDPGTIRGSFDWGMEGNGREEEWKNLTIHSQLTNARPEPRRWMAADAAEHGGRR
jgi:hypothetical protein